MFKTSMELKKAKLENEKYKKENEALQHQYKLREGEIELRIENAKNEIRKEMQKALVLADVDRAKLQGKLEVHEKLSITKDEMIKFFDKAISEIAKKPSLIMAESL